MRIPDIRGPHIAVEWLAYWFYGIAAVGSSIGQIWAMAAAPVWPNNIPIWIRIAAVAPFAVVIDLAGVVTSAFADARRKLGEAAYGWRTLSLFSVAIAVGINIAGHSDALQYAVAFGFLGILAYTIWLLHSAARRRDALRAAGKLAHTAPVYGPWQWITDFHTTRLARQLALTDGLALHPSLTAARQHLRNRNRDQALAKRIETLVRSMHKDTIRADIAVATIDLDTLATKTANLINLDAWATTIATDLNPPTPTTMAAARQLLSVAGSGLGEELADADADAEPDDDERMDGNSPQWTEEFARTLQRVPVLQADYARWRELWTEISTSGANTRELADQYRVSIRKIQHIRKAGTLGLLDTVEPPNRSISPGDSAPRNGAVLRY